MTRSGAAMVERLYAELKLDPSVAVRTARGFTWWGPALAQHVWAAPGSPPRIHIRTDMLRSLDLLGSVARYLGEIAGAIALSGPMRDPARPNRMVLAASSPLGSEPEPWMARYLSVVARVQMWEAHWMSRHATARLIVKLDESQHPTGGVQRRPDERTGYLDQVIRPLGQPASLWPGPRMLAALEDLRASSTCLLANGDRKLVVAEFACGPSSSLLRMEATARHPLYGSGLFVLLTIPAQVSERYGPAHALRLNRREMSKRVAQRSFGSWCWQDLLAYVAYYPNALVAMDLEQDIAASMAARARWAAAELAGGPRPEPPTTATERMIRRFGIR